MSRFNAKMSSFYVDGALLSINVPHMSPVRNELIDVAYGYDYPTATYFIDLFIFEDEPVELFYGRFSMGKRITRGQMLELADYLQLEKLVRAVASDLPL